MMYKNLTERGMDKVDALKIIINNVEGDYSQLSPSLADIAEVEFVEERMAKGGNIKEYKVGDKVLYAPNGKFHGAKNVLYIKNAEVTNVEVVSGVVIYTLEIKNKYGQVINKFVTSNIKELQLDPDFEMAKGGKISDRIAGARISDIQTPFYFKSKMGIEGMDKDATFQIQDIPNYGNIKVYYYDGILPRFFWMYKDELEKRTNKGDFIEVDKSQFQPNMEESAKMAKGGMTIFQDKVNAISKRLEGTKVPKRLEKDYGKRYNHEESIQAARRIAGARLRDSEMANGGFLSITKKEILNDITHLKKVVNTIEEYQQDLKNESLSDWEKNNLENKIAEEKVDRDYLYNQIRNDFKRYTMSKGKPFLLDEKNYEFLKEQGLI